MFFAGSGEEALQILETGPFDVVVTDMRMPGMNGAQLLRRVIEKYPSIVRIVLSGHSDQEMTLKSVRVAHQYLFKPCDAEALKNTVARACALQDLLIDDTLKQVASQIGSLPSLPSLYQEIIAELESEDASMNRVAQIISNDVAMTAKILQMVNSAFFALPRHIGSVGQAVNFLGLETLKTLVLSVQIFGQFRGKGVPESFLAKLWDHSMVTSAFSRAVARKENLEWEVSARQSGPAGTLIQKKLKNGLDRTARLM